LSGNQIKYIKELQVLDTLPSLSVLDLVECSVTSSPEYRSNLFQLLPHLTSLDGKDKHGDNITTTDEDDDETQDMDILTEEPNDVTEDAFKKDPYKTDTNTSRIINKKRLRIGPPPQNQKIFHFIRNGPVIQKSFTDEIVEYSSPQAEVSNDKDKEPEKPSESSHLGPLPKRLKPNTEPPSSNSLPEEHPRAPSEQQPPQQQPPPEPPSQLPLQPAPNPQPPQQTQVRYPQILANDVDGESTEEDHDYESSESDEEGDDDKEGGPEKHGGMLNLTEEDDDSNDTSFDPTARKKQKK